MVCTRAALLLNKEHIKTGLIALLTKPINTVISHCIEVIIFRFNVGASRNVLQAKAGIIKQFGSALYLKEKLFSRQASVLK
jgi:hypothetical protein